MFSAVSTASHIVGAWQKDVLSFQATWLLGLCMSRRLHTDGM